MEGLPMDVIMAEIIWRASVRALCTLKCVCKELKKTIESPEFIKFHCKFRNNNNSLVMISYGFLYLVHDLDTFSTSTITKLELPRPARGIHGATGIVGSSNGFICLGIPQGLALCNPSMHQLKLVPKPSQLPTEPIDVHRDVIGFGYDFLSEDYKIVRLADHKAGIGLVYSLRGDSWETVEPPLMSPMSSSNCFLPFYYGFNKTNVALINNCLHWLNFLDRFFLRFDLHTYDWGRIQVPDYIEHDHINQVVTLHSTVFDGLLCICCVTKAGASQVWVMKEYGVEESWTQLFSISGLAGVIPRAYCKGRTQLVFSRPHCNKLCRYDIQRRKIIYFKLPEGVYGITGSVFIYEETLVPLPPTHIHLQQVAVDM